MKNIEINQADIRIRNYKISDYHATLKILRKLNETQGLMLNEKQWTKSSGLRQFKPNLKRITLVAEQKSTGNIIGMGVIEAITNIYGVSTGYLGNWAIKKEYIGQNVGKMLADHGTKILTSWGCKSIRINLGYGVPQKLLKVFGNAGFNPIMIVLEKNIDDIVDKQEKTHDLNAQELVDKSYQDQKLATNNE